MTIHASIEEVPAEREEWWEAFRAYHRAWNMVGPAVTQFECQQSFVMPLFDEVALVITMGMPTPCYFIPYQPM